MHYDIHPWRPADSLQELAELQEALKQRIAEHKRTKLRQAKQRKQAQPLGKLPRTFLDYASLPKHQYEPVHILFGHMGQIPAATQLSIIAELEKNNFAEFKRFRAGKSFIRLVRITDGGWSFLQKPPASKPGKGGIVHSHISHWVHATGPKRGYEECVLEWPVPETNHSCDVGFKINDVWHGVEVIVDCTSNISDHVKACFIKSNIVQTLTIVTTQKSLWSKVENIIVSEASLMFFVNRIKFEVAEKYMRDLWP
jgi:hypothetical protein